MGGTVARRHAPAGCVLLRFPRPSDGLPKGGLAPERRNIPAGSFSMRRSPIEAYLLIRPKPVALQCWGGRCLPGVDRTPSLGHNKLFAAIRRQRDGGLGALAVTGACAARQRHHSALESRSTPRTRQAGNMPNTGPFEKHATGYDEWFERNRFVYQSELRAVGNLLPRRGIGVEIGVGTGRFAAPLGLQTGVEPSRAMALVARRRGIQVVRAAAEALPLMDGTFDVALMVTALSFLDDIAVSFHETHRVLRAGGSFVVGFIDGESRLGRAYQGRNRESVFYAEARFYPVGAVVSSMKDAGFVGFDFAQTIFRDLQRLRSPEPVRRGHGEGSFVVLRGVKPAGRG